jgi:tetratricopeptide (TPR) repeat protein
MLKQFDFFSEISNWFRPFYKENILIEDCLPDNQQGKWDFFEGLEQSFYMCNSDKYSFCFNLKNLPDDQSRNVIGLFNAEAGQLREVIKEDGLLHKPGINSYVFTQYIQDLYRFFKLHPLRSDFNDIFGFQWDIAGNVVIAGFNHGKIILRKAAEFLFAREHFGAAAEIFALLANSPDTEQSVYEKLAYSYQRISRYTEAIEYYKRAELFDTNRMWSIKKIIFCYRKAGDNESALKWALEAEALAPNDAYLQTMLGNCYVDLHNYSDALVHYFKAEILDPENIKVLRPIAWCCLVTGKLDLARSYFNRLPEISLTPNDLINAGHTEMCSGNKAKAMELYQKAISNYNISMQSFSDTMIFDTPHLLALGVNRIDIQLIIDFISLKFTPEI